MASGEVLQAVGKVAGIGGLALGVLLLIFRDIIRKNIFPKLRQTHAYRLISLIVMLTFAISAAGMGAYVYLQSGSHEVPPVFPSVSAQPSIVAHLALIDGHRYAEAYANLSGDAKKRISYDLFERAFETQRAPRGKVQQRAFYGLTSASQLPDMTKGAFTTATYLSDFEFGGRYVESITLEAEKGDWKVLFHSLVPCLPPACH